jgi:hypothetical protein
MRGAPIGTDFDPEFRPEPTPKEMLALGIFCGRYMTDTRAEFPASWSTHAKLASARRDCALNFFGVDAGQNLAVWRVKGWIHPDDPRDWFQWYCRYYMGRRMPDEDQLADPAVEGDAPAHPADRAPLHAGRSRLPPAAAPSPPALGLRQPEDLTP